MELTKLTRILTEIWRSPGALFFQNELAALNGELLYHPYAYKDRLRKAKRRHSRDRLESNRERQVRRHCYTSQLSCVGNRRMIRVQEYRTKAEEQCSPLYYI
jgi:hypothetical protein